MAVMTEERFDWKIYKYRIDACTLCINDVKSKIDVGTIQSFYIEKDYDNDFLPVFMIDIAMGAMNYQTILDAQDSAYFIFDIKILVDMGDNNFTEISDFLSGRYTILPINSTPFIEKESYENMIKSSSYGEGEMNTTDFKNNYTFILERTVETLTTKQVVNKILTQTTMLDAVSYLLTKSGCSNVLMTIPDNTTVYNELPLLPIALINQLRYLNNYYGLYKEGAQIFFDMDRIYILRNNASCSAYNDTEPRNVSIYTYSSSLGNDYGKGSYTSVKTKFGYISVGMDQLTTKDLSSTGTQYYGNNTLLINNNGSASTTQVENTVGDLNSFNIITTSTHNQFATSERELRLKELKNVVTINTTNCDLRLLTPNKCFRVITSDTGASEKLKNRYRLVSVKSIFNREGIVFTNETQIVLKESDIS